MPWIENRFYSYRLYSPTILRAGAGTSNIPYAQELEWYIVTQNCPASTWPARFVYNGLPSHMTLYAVIEISQES